MPPTSPDVAPYWTLHASTGEDITYCHMHAIASTNQALRAVGLYEFVDMVMAHEFVSSVGQPDMFTSAQEGECERCKEITEHMERRMEESA